jgi:hypothetical protein
MAFLAPFLPYLAAGAAGVALGRASKPKPSADDIKDAVINGPGVGIAERPTTPPDTTPVPPAAPEPVAPPSSEADTAAGSSTAAGGEAEATAMEEAATTEAEKAAADTARKGRRSTILTSSKGLLAEKEGTLRSGRSLMGGGLIR